MCVSTCHLTRLSSDNGRHVTDDIFKCIFMNEEVRIWIKISLKFVPKDLIDNNQTLDKIMYWRRIDAKPLSAPVLTIFSDAYVWHWGDLRINSSPPGQRGRHFAHDIFSCIFVNEKFDILIEISQKFVPKGPIDNNIALV